MTDRHVLSCHEEIVGKDAGRDAGRDDAIEEEEEREIIKINILLTSFYLSNSLSLF